MDQEKLARLRARYADAKGSQMYDPEFAAVAATQFTSADRRKWPFMDPATFLGAPIGPRPSPVVSPRSTWR
jgi:guanidinopropionase